MFGLFLMRHHYRHEFSAHSCIILKNLTSHTPRSSSRPKQLCQWKSAGWLQCLDRSLWKVEHTASPASHSQRPEDACKELKMVIRFKQDILKDLLKIKSSLTCQASRKSLYLMRAREILTFAYSDSLADGIIWRHFYKYYQWFGNVSSIIEQQ